ncbi:MAG TPA: Fe-S protein assembly chaperone HscA [Polyangiaceae bacterium]|nr:Fe-S protein assembly chaperone HscA [Polyangiaceae bacterium]
MALFEIFDPKSPPRPIGIDLGTTNSLVAYVKNERPVAIADCDLQVLVPSVVAYLPDREVIVGRRAAELASQHPRDTIVSAKRFMGRGAGDPETRRLGPYTFVEPKPGEANTVRFRVAGEREVTPVEVSAEILRALKVQAEGQLRSVGGAVITVPAYFDDAQRQATKDAARLAGLDVLRLISEPTAAALAYGLEKKKKGTFAVYDLGGGTFDVTILVLDDGVFQVRSTGGDSQLGGDDMDRALAHELLAKLGFGEERQTPQLVRLVLDEARKAKHALSDRTSIDAEVPGQRRVNITRARFEDLLRPLLERTGVACRRALKDAGLTAQEIDGVILVGGATRVPAVRTYVTELFGQPPLADIDPDQVVALGAAVQADLLAGEGRSEDILLLDVTPLSLGIEVGGGVVDKVLPRNSTIPCAVRATYTTQQDNQTGFEIHVVQGEREMVSDDRSLARFTLRGIPPMPAGMARLEVSFHVDADGLLSVHAKEVTTGIEQTVSVKPSYGLDDAAVEQMLLDALDHGEDDLHTRRLAENRVEARRILMATKKGLLADADLLEPGERQGIERACAALEAAAAGEDPSSIHARIEALDEATTAFAGRRMNRAIARAIEGQRVDLVEDRVKHAKGVDQAHAVAQRPGDAPRGRAGGAR